MPIWKSSSSMRIKLRLRLWQTLGISETRLNDLVLTLTLQACRRALPNSDPLSTSPMMLQIPKINFKFLTKVQKLPSPSNWGWQREDKKFWTPIWKTPPPDEQSCQGLIRCG
ncbi:hypothetical protein PoB_001557900 [Plakobranchus ocellatus]|uniref:Uncharacterized protein n=1 Tax=Plakobranchus ocellatus TaxID=259542 RepID=A0AAV3Z3V6_9GAST|nr:hypothetical protein PoB_001557900 [Plakobranchus ocellatus]